MFNKAILIGRLTAEPELKQTANGISVCSFSIACNRPYSGKGGERQTDFIDIVAWRSNAEFICKYFHKGNAIGVEGSIQVRSFEDKSGNRRRAVEVVVDNAFFVESKGAASASPSQTFGQPTAPAMAPQPVSYSSGSFGDFEEIEGEDDLPF